MERSSAVCNDRSRTRSNPSTSPAAPRDLRDRIERDRSRLVSRRRRFTFALTVGWARRAVGLSGRVLERLINDATFQTVRRTGVRQSNTRQSEQSGNDRPRLNHNTPQASSRIYIYITLFHQLNGSIKIRKKYINKYNTTKKRKKKKKKNKNLG